VVVSLPEDMQNELCGAVRPGHYQHAIAAPGADALAKMEAMLGEARRPLLILGGGGWSAAAVAAMRQFAERFELPALAGFRRQDLFDNTHPNYAGVLGLGTNPSLVAMVHEADLLVVVGERLGDMTTAGYTLIDIPRPRQRLVHVQAGAEELGALYEADLLIGATPRDFAMSIAELAPSTSPGRAAWIARGRSGYEEYSRLPTTGRPKIDAAHIIRDLSERLPSNAVICNGAGFYTSNVHRYYTFRDYGTQLAPTSGAMGYGFPAAIAAKIVHPDRPVVCFAGDGCFLMASQEFATAIMYGLSVIVVVIDNGSFGSIRGHQEKRFPDRVVATDLVNPDFVALAKAYGAYAEEVFATEDFSAAFERALASGRPALLTFKQDVRESLGLAAKQPEAVA
jgi:acetolactate synthase-1/2/3 large subunit